jgi:hypothetical protein
MRLARQWAHMMSSTIRVAARTSQDGYGKPTYGTPVSYRGHYTRRARMVRTMSGQTVPVDATMWLGSAPSILPTAQVTLSTQDAGSTESWALHPTIVAVERHSDQRGPHHTTLFLSHAERGTNG